METAKVPARYRERVAVWRVIDDSGEVLAAFLSEDEALAYAADLEACGWSATRIEKRLAELL